MKILVFVMRISLSFFFLKLIICLIFILRNGKITSSFTTLG